MDSKKVHVRLPLLLRELRMNNIQTLSNEQLVGKTKQLRSNEKEVLYSLLLHLGEVDERGLYREEGFSSFFTYLEVGLGYSKASAYRRQEGARFLRKKPELYKKLVSGELSFSSLVELSKCAAQTNLGELVEQSAGKSGEEVHAIVALEIAPKVAKKKDSIRVVKCAAKSEEPLLKSESSSAAEPNYQIAFQADEGFMKLYQEAKALAGGHSMEEVFKKVMKDYTERKSPKERIKRREKRQAKAVTKTRYVPVRDKDEVLVRDEGQCTYVSDEGRRCECREHLEFDHIRPFALGGESTAENLRLLCRAHNQLEAERVFGRKFMEARRAR